MDELTHNMNKAGICPQCYKTYNEFKIKKWIIYKEDSSGLYIHFNLKEITEEKDDKSYGTIITDHVIPPNLEKDNFAWMCHSCYDDIKNELKSKKDDEKGQDEKWIDGLDDWR